MGYRVIGVENSKKMHKYGENRGIHDPFMCIFLFNLSYFIRLGRAG